jgi:hypothetical protein
VIAAGALLDGTNVSFDFRSMLIFAGNIEGCMEAGSDVAMVALEFHIRLDLVDFETTLEVCLVHMTDTFDEGKRCVIGERFGCDEMDITGDGHEEANFVNGHVVYAQSDHAIFVGNSQRKAERVS